MESVEPIEFEEIDPWHPNINKCTVSLKEGIDLNKLASGGGVDIEIKSKLTKDDKGEESPNSGSEENYRQEDLYDYLNPECTGFEGSEDSGSDHENTTPFTRMARSMTDITEGKGLVLKKVLRSGVGGAIPEGATVRVHYNGYLEYSDEPYDSSRLRNKQQQFRLGRGEVLPGWEVGVATMRKSELSRFLVQPEYAFGIIGCPPRIPPNATIMFEIEVISFIDHKAADDFNEFSKEEKQKATLDVLLKVANAEREAGNDFFKQNIIGPAANKYSKAVRILEGSRLKNSEEEEQWKSVMLKLYLNQSLCSLRMKKPKVAITQCRKALEMDSKNVKANFRLGQAYMQLAEFKQSRDYLIKAGKLCPGNQEIREELLKLDRTVKKFKAMETSMYSKMIPGSSQKDKKKNTTGKSNGDYGQDEETLSEEKLAEMKALYMEKLSIMKETNSMMEMVLPISLSKEDVLCAEEVAEELNLSTEKKPGCGLRIYKQLPEALSELYRS